MSKKSKSIKQLMGKPNSCLLCHAKTTFDYNDLGEIDGDPVTYWYCKQGHCGVVIKFSYGLKYFCNENTLIEAIHEYGPERSED